MFAADYYVQDTMRTIPLDLLQRAVMNNVYIANCSLLAALVVGWYRCKRSISISYRQLSDGVVTKYILNQLPQQKQWCIV